MDMREKFIHESKLIVIPISKYEFCVNLDDLKKCEDELENLGIINEYVFKLDEQGLAYIRLD